MGCIVALDQGTTSSRTIVFDEQQQVIGFAQQAYEQLFPRPGWVEHDPREIWRTQRETMIAAIADAGLGREDIAAVGITNQRETTIVWDRRTGEPIHNAIVWQDSRTAEACQRQRDSGLEPQIQRATGLLLDPYFSASKVRWILDHCDGAAAAAAAGQLAFGTVDSWLVWQLTNGNHHITDVSNASRTSLFNLHLGDWDDALLELWQIPRSMLATVVPSSGIVARCETAEVAGVPIAGIAGDQQAALFGQGCFEPGDAKCTYGTGCFVLLHCGSEPVMSAQRLLTTVAWRIGDQTEFALEGSVFMGGATVEWLRDGLSLFERSADIEALAASVESSDGVVLVPAFAGLGAPYWDPHARGAILGMTRGTTGAHIARAGLEGIAFQVADVLGAMQADTPEPISSLKVDGGASANALLMQLQADILGVTLRRPKNPESTALGCAGLAGIAVGTWGHRDDLRALAQTDATFSPGPPTPALATQRRLWSRAVERAGAWTEKDDLS